MLDYCKGMNDAAHSKPRKKRDEYSGNYSSYLNGYVEGIISNLESVNEK